MVLNQIKNEKDRDAFLNNAVNDYLEVIEQIPPEEATEEYKHVIKNFFDRMLKEYKIREAKD